MDAVAVDNSNHWRQLEPMQYIVVHIVVAVLAFVGDLD